MIGRGVSENHGLFHGTVDIGFARNGAGCFGDSVAEMSGDTQVGEGDMAGQLILYDPVGQEEVGHILYLTFQRVGQWAYEVKVVIGAITQFIEGVQNDFIALQREHAAKKENDLFPCCVLGFGHMHGMVDGGINSQIEQIHFLSVGVKFFRKIVGMTACVAENGIRMRQGIGIQQMKQPSGKTARRKHPSVKAECVIEGDKKVNHLVSAVKFPGKKG